MCIRDRTNIGTKVEAKCIVVAAGAGSFVPRKPPIENIENFENKNVFYAIRDKSIFKNKKILIAGGGDSALDWTNELSKYSNIGFYNPTIFCFSNFLDLLVEMKFRFKRVYLFN